MAKYEPGDLRNISLCGQMSAGKTMLAEAMLFKSGAITRLGLVGDGSTVSDYYDDEKARGYSLSSTCLNFSYADKEFNIIDTPGGVDFFGGQVSGVVAADIVAICLNAAKGIEVMSRKVWELAQEMGRSRIIIISRMDSENTSYQELLATIQKTFGNKCIPFVIPQGEGTGFNGVIDCFGKDIPDDLASEAEDLRNKITECAVESDDAMMEKYLEDGEISEADLKALMPQAISKGTLVPVFVVASEKDLGIAEMLKNLADFAPSPLQTKLKIIKGEGDEAEESEITPRADQPLLGQVFKTVSDPHVGKLSFVRIWNGSFENKTQVTLSATGKPERIAQLYRHNGEKHSDLPGGNTGDIVTIGKIEALNTGDLIYAAENELNLPAIPFPKPMVGLAIMPKARGDEQKIGTALHRLCAEDSTFISERDPNTHELVVRGMGQIHLDVMLNRLKERFNVEVSTTPPKIPYLETIMAKADGHHRHKKQSGGAGQFAEVYFHVWPKERGEGFEFINSIVGGAISQSFVGSSEKGVRQALLKGPLAGYPVVDIAVEVYDGKEHPVDSKDIAFQTAGRIALHDAMKNAKPCLIEPIVNMEIVFPPQYTGDISGDISGRRGRPTGMEMVGEMQMFKAEVPLAEVADYGSALKAITQGEGFFSLELSHYESVPGNIASQVIAKLKAETEKAEK